MITQTMVQPSSWVETGIQLSKGRDRFLFKFTDELQLRLMELNQRKKESALSGDEEAELIGILELASFATRSVRIFTLLNAKIVAKS